MSRADRVPARLAAALFVLAVLVLFFAGCASSLKGKRWPDSVYWTGCKRHCADIGAVPEHVTESDVDVECTCTKVKPPQES